MYDKCKDYNKIVAEGDFMLIKRLTGIGLKSPRVTGIVSMSPPGDYNRLHVTRR
ncbi:hypothetical protein DPMN_038420 [Dreissena polymorpha]|uniref:Uncharacterized protein n=1 Tax=Dreissena polymorpha TaxID=45954 RepID=A0A9D4MGX9_DREPO|nr:hypothetical protein DPMN_038420 [Dreissena polymorpha]